MSTAAGLSAVYRRYTDGDWTSRVYDRFGLALTIQHQIAIDRKHNAYIAATADWEFHADPAPLPVPAPLHAELRPRRRRRPPKKGCE